MEHYVSVFPNSLTQRPEQIQAMTRQKKVVISELENT